MNIINIIHGDGVKALEAMEENQYDLAIVDPPYGNNLSGGRSAKNGWNQKIDWNKCNKGWNLKIPDKSYFKELRAVSKNQIIWGGNYFANLLPASQCWLMWDKGQRDFSLADGELAWTSFDKAMRIFTYSRAAANRELKIHNTQKPAQLYKWSLKNYAKPRDKIIDTHGGSFSHAIACIDMGFSLDIYEIDDDYYSSAVERIKRHVSQLDLSRPPCKINYITN